MEGRGGVERGEERGGEEWSEVVILRLKKGGQAGINQSSRGKKSPLKQIRSLRNLIKLTTHLQRG